MVQPGVNNNKERRINLCYSLDWENYEKNIELLEIYWVGQHLLPVSRQLNILVFLRKFILNYVGSVFICNKIL